MTSLPAPNQDPDFNINTAMNTFNQRLGELVRSGQMTVAQAQAAQGDMRALQLNPAAANRQAATDIAQRHLQVGKYAPAQQPQGGLTLAEQPEIVVTPQRPMPQGVGPSSPMPVTKSPFIDEKGNTHFPDGSVMADGPGTVPPWVIPPLPPSVKGPAPFRAPPTDMREVIGASMPPPGVRGGDTRIFADQPMPQDPGFNINTATNTFYKTLGERVASGQMTMDQARAAQAEMRALQLNPAMANRAAATEIAQRNLQVGQYAPRPQGLTLSNVPQLPQGGGMPPMPSQQLINAFSPRQPSGVDNSTFMAGDPNFRFGQTPQQMAPNAQAMAMGGLMRKYGGMC